MTPQPKITYEIQSRVSPPSLPGGWFNHIGESYPTLEEAREDLRRLLAHPKPYWEWRIVRFTQEVVE